MWFGAVFADCAVFLNTPGSGVGIQMHNRAGGQHLHELQGLLGFGWLCLAVPCWKLDVGCWMFGVHHKRSEYNPSFPPPSGWSGTTLVPLWYHPIPVEASQRGVFNEASLYCLQPRGHLSLGAVSRRRATARSLCQARASSAESFALSIASAKCNFRRLCGTWFWPVR